MPEGPTTVTWTLENGQEFTATSLEKPKIEYAKGGFVDIPGNMSAKHDAVNHPDHYASGDIECIDAIEVATKDLPGFEGMCAGNAMKYIWRYRMKGKPEEDIKKAIWYLQRLLKYMEEK